MAQRKNVTNINRTTTAKPRAKQTSRVTNSVSSSTRSRTSTASTTRKSSTKTSTKATSRKTSTGAANKVATSTKATSKPNKTDSVITKILGAIAALPKHGISKLTFTIVLVFSLIAISIGFLYGPAKTYYLSTRENDKLQAQYESITETNENLKSEIEYLQTEEGIKDYANKKLGLIEQGENTGSVSGLTEDAEIDDSATETSSRLKYKQIKAPEK